MSSFVFILFLKIFVVVPGVHCAFTKILTIYHSEFTPSIILLYLPFPISGIADNLGHLENI
jgi:hypothetical protein